MEKENLDRANSHKNDWKYKLKAKILYILKDKTILLFLIRT
jgi:hypothetical protein